MSYTSALSSPYSVHGLIYPTMNNSHGQQPGWAWLAEDRRAALTASFLVSLGE